MSPKKPKFSGILGTKIELDVRFDNTGKRIPIPGIIRRCGGTEKETIEYIDDMALQEQLQRLPLLFEHFKIDQTSEDAYLKLVLAMAEDSIPGFQFKPSKKAVGKWQDKKKGTPTSLAFNLYNLVKQYSSENQAFESIKAHYSQDFGEDPGRRFYEIKPLVEEFYKKLKEEYGYPDDTPIFTFTGGRIPMV